MRQREKRGFFLTRFLRGAACPFRAIRLIFSSGKVFLLALVPFVLCLVIYLGVFMAVLFLADNVADLIVEPGAWWRTVVRTALIVALPVAFLVLAVFTYTLACFVVAGPLYDWLSAAVEKKLTGSVEEEPFSVKNMLVDLVRSVAYAVVILLAALCVLLFGLLFVPVTTVLALMGSAVLLALEYLDYPMGRRRMTLGERARFARRYGWELLGLGLPLLLGLVIPFVGAAFLPIGVVAGTLLFMELQGGAGGALG